MHDWKDTRLWKALGASENPEREDIEALLVTWMKQIQQVLAVGGTSPNDFALHDAEHSFRVAEWMAEIIPEDVIGRLSAYELAMLLLSAYLHDIGMTPEQAKVQRHWRHLVFGPDKDGLTQTQSADFQRWLDDERDGITPPLAKGGQVSEDNLRLAAELITYYARHRHNDWSEEWIRGNALRSESHSGQVLDLGSYEGWIDDLVRICRSHHYGYDQLVKDAFDPRPAGKRGEVVHLRYLACVLRIADILDVDPERTPPVLFHHREIAPASVIFWWKDHDFWIRRDGPTLVVHALPSSAVLEKAVRDTAGWIRGELETCARLSREKPFTHCSFRSLDPLPHQWSFPESLQLQVKPRNDEYVYIDGSFRPDTTKLLELLSGTHLYEEPLAAIRELLQNAFDAAKEEMALTRLRWDEPNDPMRLSVLPELHRVELRFKESYGRFWLVCTDTGVGMTRLIIENYLLVSGKSRRHDILDLERRCQAAGFRLGRTGQFGIGVLSYFMIADRVEIYTRRSVAHGDAEPHGWRFETQGVGTFGELRRDFLGAAGSTIQLRLREGVIGTPEGFLADVKKYLRSVVLYSPCPLFLTEENAPEPLLKMNTGWQPIEQLVAEEYIDELKEHLPIGRSRGAGIPRNLASHDLEELQGRFLNALEWLSEEGDISGGLGRYRIAIPFYKIFGHRSGVFFDFRGDSTSDGGKLKLSSSSLTALAIDPDMTLGLHGMRLQDFTAAHGDWRPYLCQVNWEDARAGTANVARSTFQMTNEAMKAISWVAERAQRLLGEVFSSSASVFAELNAHLSTEVPLTNTEAWWLVKFRTPQELAWSPLNFPAVGRNSLASYWRSIDRVEWNGQPVSIAQNFEAIIGTNRARLFSFDESPSLVPSRMTLAPDAWNPAPLYLTPKRDLPDRVFTLVEFPPAWAPICGFLKFAAKPILNPIHLFAKSVDDADLEWYRSFDRRIPASEEVFNSKGRAALFVLKLVSGFGVEAEWDRLESSFKVRIWESIFSPDALAQEIIFWTHMELLGLLVLRPAYVKMVPYDDSRIHQYLPDPGPEWKLTVTYTDEEPNDRPSKSQSWPARGGPNEA